MMLSSSVCQEAVEGRTGESGEECWPKEMPESRSESGVRDEMVRW